MSEESSPPLDAPYYDDEEKWGVALTTNNDDEVELASSRFVASLPLESELADMEPLFDLSEILRDIDGSSDPPPQPPQPPQLRRTLRKRKSKPYSPPPPPQPPPMRRATHVERAKLAGLDLGGSPVKRNVESSSSSSSSSGERCRWSKEEDNVLRECFAYEGDSVRRLLHWKEIAARLPNRGPIQCLLRWRSIQPGIRRGRWDAEEDARLRELVEKYGTHRWRVVGVLMATRTNKQCRERWLNALAPSIRTEQWTPQELRRLVEEVAERGRAWASLEKLFPGRTANDIKNKWYLICGRRDTRDKNEWLREKRRRVEEGEVL